MDEKRIDNQIPEEAAPKTEDTSFVKKAAKAVWAAIRSIPGEFLNFWRSYPPKARKIAVILAAVVLVAGVVATLVFPDYSDCAFYLKDGELYMCRPNGATLQITDDLILESEEIPYADWYLADIMNNYTHLSKDGKRLFYMDHASLKRGTDGPSLEEYELYWIDLTKTLSFPVKIAEDVVGAFYVNSKGNLVTYRKEKYVKQLYQYNMLVSKQVATIWYTDPFRVSEDGDVILYAERDQATFTMYRKDGHGKPEKMDEKVKSLIDYNQDFSVIAYEKDDQLYIKKGDSAPQLVTGAEHKGVKLLDDGTMFYATQEVESYKGIDFVVDDWNGVSFNGYSHQQILDKIKVKDVSNHVYTLWYFDGKESQKISDTALATKWCSEKAGICFYEDYGTTELPKLSLKDMISDCQKQGMQGTTPDQWVPTTANTAWRDNACLSICVGAERKATTLKIVKRVHINDVGTTAYIWVGSEDLYIGPVNLYRVCISEDGIGEPELLMQFETDYNVSKGEFYSDDMYVYVDRGILYVNGEKVDDKVLRKNDLHGYEVAEKSINYCEETGNLYYLKNTDDGRVLVKYDGKASEVIGKNVRDYILTPRGSVIIQCFDGMWIWNGQFSMKLSQSVEELVAAS